jgi:Tol biopolymer transport system component
MRKMAGIFLLLLFLLFCGCSSPATEQLPPKDRETSIPAGSVKVTPAMDLHPPILHSDKYYSPVPLPRTINTAGAEDSPFILPDGKTLYFFFTPDPNIPAEKQLFDGVTGIYVARRERGTWTKPEHVVLQDPGKLALDGCEFVQGSTMWFCSAREGYTGVSMFTAEYRDGRWGNWQYTGDTLNKEYGLGEMHITSDGKEMYFHSSRAGGKGGLDIWVSRNSGGVWQVPRNVQAINSPDNEGWPFVTGDGSQLWFTRFYNGTPAIFVSEKKDGSWQEPELVISQFAGEPTLDDAGNIYFVHHFYRDNAMLEADIYVANRK